MSDFVSITPERNPLVIEQFSVYNDAVRRKILQTIVDDEHELYIHVQNAPQAFVTEALHLDWNHKTLWVGTPYDKTALSACNGNTSYTIVAFPDGVKVQFSGTGIHRVSYQGAEAIELAIPTHLVRLQRRNYFRVIADEELRQTMDFFIPSGEGSETLEDLSLAGCALTVSLTSGYRVGQILKDVRIGLPDGNDTLLAELEVKNIKPLQDTPNMVQLGCELRLLQKGAERRLQRFLLATERRQRAMQMSVEG